MTIVRFGPFNEVAIVDGVRIEKVPKKDDVQRVTLGEDSLVLKYGRVVNVLPPLRPAYRLVLWVDEDGKEELFRMPVIGWQVSLDLDPVEATDPYWVEPISIENSAVNDNKSSVVICDDFWWAGKHEGFGMGEEGAIEYLREDIARKRKYREDRKDSAQGGANGLQEMHRLR